MKILENNEEFGMQSNVKMMGFTVRPAQSPDQMWYNEGDCLSLSAKKR
jgi:hypothetical protein